MSSSVEDKEKGAETSDVAREESEPKPTDSAHSAAVSSTGADLGSNSTLKKIGRLLTNTQGADWKQGGFELGPEARVPRPIQVHEFVYVRDLPNNSIVVRAATPVSCVYAPGGYKLNALTSGNYSIELRDRVFDPDKLVDPKFASNFKGKFVEVLATGEVARKLFDDVRNLVRGSTRNLEQEFAQKSRDLFERLLDMVEAKQVTGWTRSVAMVEGRDNTTYVTTYEGMEFSLLRSVQGWDAKYQLTIKQDKFTANQTGSTPKLVFQTLEQHEQDNQIDSLEKKLLDLGLTDEGALDDQDEG